MVTQKTRQDLTTFSQRFNVFLDHVGLPEKRRPKILAERLGLTYAAARKWTALNQPPRASRLREIVDIYWQKDSPAAEDILAWLIEGGDDVFSARASAKDVSQQKEEGTIGDVNSVEITQVYFALSEAAGKLGVVLEELPFNEVKHIVAILTKDVNSRGGRPSPEITEALLRPLIDKKEP